MWRAEVTWLLATGQTAPLQGGLGSQGSADEGSITGHGSPRASRLLVLTKRLEVTTAHSCY